MVIDIINVLRVAIVKAKDHSPVGAYRDRPKALPISLKRVQPKSRHINIGMTTAASSRARISRTFSTCST